jgi:hypothetical protein
MDPVMSLHRRLPRSNSPTSPLLELLNIVVPFATMKLNCCCVVEVCCIDHSAPLILYVLYVRFLGRILAPTTRQALVG